MKISELLLCEIGVRKHVVSQNTIVIKTELMNQWIEWNYYWLYYIDDYSINFIILYVWLYYIFNNTFDLMPLCIDYTLYLTLPYSWPNFFIPKTKSFFIILQNIKVQSHKSTRQTPPDSCFVWFRIYGQSNVYVYRRNISSIFHKFSSCCQPANTLPFCL